MPKVRFKGHAIIKNKALGLESWPARTEQLPGSELDTDAKTAEIMLALYGPGTVEIVAAAKTAEITEQLPGSELDTDAKTAPRPEKKNKTRGSS